MNISDVYNSLNQAYSDWKEYLVNPKFIRRNGEITWAERDCDTRLVDPVTRNNFVNVVEKGQYSLQINDGSIVQIYYQYNKQGRQLNKASLGY